MKNTVLIFALSLLFGAGLTAQDQVRYTQSAAEIDLVKQLETAYNAGNWDKITSFYHADAVADHNGEKASPKALAAGLRATAEECSYYKLDLLASELERIINDRGEMWVNAWGSWQGVLKGTKDTVTTPVHLVYEMKDGKIVREFGFYDTMELAEAMAAASWGKDQLLLIREDHVKPGSEAAYPKMVASYVTALDDTKSAELHWMSAMTEDKSMVLHQMEINSLMDVQAKRDEESRGHMAMGNEKMQMINGAFLGSVSDRKEYVVRRHAERSYWPPEGFDGGVGYMNMIKMTVAPENYPAFISLVDEGVKLGRDGKSPLPFAFFTYELGGSMTEGVIVEYALSAADYKTRKAADDKIYGTKEGQAWYAKLEKILTGFEETKLMAAPKISRPAKK